MSVATWLKASADGGRPVAESLPLHEAMGKLSKLGGVVSCEATRERWTLRGSPEERMYSGDPRGWVVSSLDA